MFNQWIDLLTVIVILLTTLIWIPLVGSNPNRWRDYTVWSVYLILAVLVSNWVLTTAVGQIF